MTERALSFGGAARFAELRRQVPGATTIVATFEELPLDATCDLVLGAAAALDEIRRVLPAQVALIGDLTVDLARRSGRLPA